MNNHHPIDDFFRSKLQDFELDPPMHLWDHIETERNARLRGAPFGKKSTRLILASIVVLSAGLFWWFGATSTPGLGAFPVPLKGGNAAVLVPTSEPPIANQPPALYVQADPVLAIATALPKKEDILPALVAESTLSSDQLIPAESAPMPDAPLQLALPEIAARYPGLLPAKAPEGLNATPLPIEKATPGWRLYLSAFAGPQMAFKSWTPGSGFDETAISRQREAEQPWLSDFRAIGLHWVSPTGLTVTTGVQYHTLNEKFDYYNPSETRLKTAPIEGPAGLLVAQDTIAVTGQRWKTARNYQRSLAIPLLLGFERARGKTTLAVYGGALLELRTDYRKVILDPESGDPVELAGTSTQGWQLNWQLHAAWQYRISPTIQVFVAPQLSLISPVTTDYGRERFFATGLAAGIRTRMY